MFVSDAMRRWLDFVGDLPPATTRALLPPEFPSLLGKRGHQTCEIVVPEVGPDAAGRSVTAHFVTLQLSDNLRQPDLGPITIGCLGDFRSDSEVPWEDWFGETGTRNATELGERIAKIRADRSTRGNMLLAGNSTTSRQFRNRVNLACDIRCHVGLIGETGSGTSELASLIHHADGSRSGEPFVCLDASLMDSELLEVYASPAIVPLSDASRDSTRGRSTLCLERLDEMPRDGQERLVQFMQAYPQGLRIIGILNSDLGQGPDFQMQDFQQQLEEKLETPVVDAINMYSIYVPTFAQRRADLALIGQSLLRSSRLSREAVELIESYPWPGNWDELVAAMQFAEEVVHGERITREHFPLAIRSYRTPESLESRVTRSSTGISIAPPEERPEDFQIKSLDTEVQAYEAELIEKAMIAAGGNKAEAARRLGISRARLLRKLESS